MFKNVLQSTPLTTDAADAFFSERIYGQPYRYDITFLSTLRALLGKCMPENEPLYLSFNSSNYSSGILGDMNYRDALRRVVDDYYELRFSLHVHEFAHPDPVSNQAWMTLIQSNLAKEYSGWQLVEKVSVFFRKVFGVLCFINPELKSVMIFVDHFGVRQMHYLQCGIFAFLPWYFDPESGVSDLEMELISSLREKTSEKYEACLAKIAEGYDFKTARIRQLLNGFESRYERIRCEQVRTEISNIIQQINNLNERIGSYLGQQREREATLLGLETKIAQSDGDSEIMEYFLCNNHLTLENVTDTRMTFVVRDYLTYFDEEMAKSVIANNESYIYKPNGRRCSNIIPAEDMKKLMTAVFIDQTIKVRLCAAYEFQLDGNVVPKQSYHYDYDCKTYTPNTHIDRYSCMGNYVQTINRLLRDHNYIGAIEQCIASCKSLNFADSAVMNEFMQRLYGISDYHVNRTCLELPDGSIVDPQGAIAYLKGEEEQNG